MKPVSADAFGSRLQDEVFASALKGYLAIVVERAQAIRPSPRRLVIVPPGQRVSTSPQRQRTAG